MGEAEHEIIGADQPRSSDPNGEELICSDDQPYDKYPPFSRGRIMLALAILVAGALLSGASVLIESLF